MKQRRKAVLHMTGLVMTFVFLELFLRKMSSSFIADCKTFKVKKRWKRTFWKTSAEEGKKVVTNIHKHRFPRIILYSSPHHFIILLKDKINIISLLKKCVLTLENVYCSFMRCKVFWTFHLTWIMCKFCVKVNY